MALLNPRILKPLLAQRTEIDSRHHAIVRNWASSVRNQSIFNQNETQIEGDFKGRILEQLLGYESFGGTQPQTIKAKQLMGSGEVDLALGYFDEDPPVIVAPFELKGANTRDLDAPMPGRKITPVQQAWNYANAVPGVKWVLVSNYLEIRLYAFGEGNQNYERFDLSRIDDVGEYAKLVELLSAEMLLGGSTFELLKRSKEAEREISELLYADYKTLRGSLIGAVNAATGGNDPVQAIGTAQKILDRILFIAFAEDSLLLPRKSLEGAYKHRDLYHPRPIWDNFKALFRAIDEGSAQLNIRRYNGGLFRFDPRIDELSLPDDICEGFKQIGAYDFGSEVSVIVLGHIFEQSIADIERLLANARGEEVDEQKKTGTSGRRKRDGIVYTPEFVARFIVEKTLGEHVERLFWETMAEFAIGSEQREYERLKFGPRRGQGEALRAERRAWYAYRNKLRTLRVVDPACGSGVFLVAAFDFLRAEYERVNKKTRALRGDEEVMGDIEDIDREILSQNLYGVDVNLESVEITKLSLWLKTARIGKELDSLDHTFRIGDSLIEDSNFAYLEHGFNWRSAFPEVFEAGGFDVVLGNPPYVRMERIKPMKPYLETRFEVVSDRADLYCYFFERGLRLLKSGGRLGFISSSTFFKTGSGAPLRRYLLRNAAIETVTDFGDLQIFEGVTTYPAILTMRREEPPPNKHMLRFWKLNEKPEGNFSVDFEANAKAFPQAKLGEGSWELEDVALRALRDKIISGKKTLKEVYGSPLYGIKTGFNEAFIVNRRTREELVLADAKSAELLKPFLEGKDLKRWRTEPRNLWIIYIPKNTIRIDDYPAIKAHLLPFKKQLEGRATRQDWFELQQAQLAYVPKFEATKIVYGEFSGSNIFSLDCQLYYLNNKCYFLPHHDFFLLSLLNSRLFRFFVQALSVAMRGDFTQMHNQYVELTPIPDAPLTLKEVLATLAESISGKAAASLEREQSLRRRIPDLCPPERNRKLNGKLTNWWELADFSAFRAEVKRLYKEDIPLLERTQWEDLFNAEKAKISQLTEEIKRHEAEVNAIVYRLFNLTKEEIALLEANLR